MNAEVKTWLHNHQEWKAQNNTMTRTFQFDNFIGAFAWMTAVALEAERANHHPDWSNVYNKVSVALSTHDAGEVTEKDLRLAEVMEKLFAKSR